MRGSERRGAAWTALHLGWLAGLFALAALLGAAAATPGYRHALHPVGLLGSAPLPVAPWFNLFGVALPGLALAAFGVALERVLVRQGHGRAARIATGLLVIAGLCFAAQAVWPLHVRDLDGAEAQRHAAAHALALLAWFASTAMLAWVLRRDAVTGRLAGVGALLAIALAALLAWPATAWWPGAAAAPGYAQRVVLGIFFLWPAVLAVALRRRRR